MRLMRLRIIKLKIKDCGGISVFYKKMQESMENKDTAIKANHFESDH